jgi:hypothetical protein
LYATFRLHVYPSAGAHQVDRGRGHVASRPRPVEALRAFVVILE